MIPRMRMTISIEVKSCRELEERAALNSNEALALMGGEWDWIADPHCDAVQNQRSGLGGGDERI